MTLIKEIHVKNFKCFRETIAFNLRESNFFIGANNAGKSAVLKAFHCFFDDSQFSSEFINKTELRSKGVGYNKSIISLTFQLSEISTKTLRQKMINEYGQILAIHKSFTYREKTNTIHVNYTISENEYDFANITYPLSEFLSRISVSYLHPQEAFLLLEKAQEKLKKRLLSNWGRNAALAETLRQLQEQWNELRQKANIYLSSGLTQSLQTIWPGCVTKIDLPEKIEDIIAISEITYKNSSELPDVSLTSQGTGAQSTILYQTHFLLDSDRTLHRGFYYPIWLIEEPESFLHADIIFKLGALLCSKDWLDKIQMLISTHSPLLLATSKKSEKQINWYVMNNHEVKKGKKVSDWEENEIKEIGVLMGDPNFDVYFKTSDLESVIIIEDKRALTEHKFKEAGINVTYRLKGVTEQKRYFDVLRSVDVSMGRSIYFLVDNDDGLSEFRNSLEIGEIIQETENGFYKVQFPNNVFLIVFPENFAVEELFTEYSDILESCANQLFNNDFTGAASDRNISPRFTRAHAAIRNKTSTGIEDAKNLLRKQQDIKDYFWEFIEQNNLKLNESLIGELLSLLKLA